jgi:hypothetical protein
VSFEDKDAFHDGPILRAIAASGLAASVASAAESAADLMQQVDGCEP